MHTIQTDTGVAVSQADKHAVVYNHFLKHIGTYVPRKFCLDFSQLQWEPMNMSHLELPFLEEEIRAVILASSKEKAPGPNGFIGLFFSSCWNLVKDDLVKEVQHFYSMNQQDLHFLNQAYVTLIPKKQNPQRVADFRPISLTHSFAKLISKMMANMLSFKLGKLIFINQTAFIRKQCIQDNFMYVQQVVKDLHKKKVTSLFIKLDISKDFDTVNWPYLLSILSHLGFGQRWTNWISSLWGTTSSCYMVNGNPGKKSLHCREARQGDPLPQSSSCWLWNLSIDCLGRLKN
jgi:hypothetical protein